MPSNPPTCAPGSAQPDWTCKIDEGPAGVASARWSPDGLCVVIVAEHQIRTTVWSLLERKCSYLKGAKHSDKGVAFSSTAGLMAVLEVGGTGGCRRGWGDGLMGLGGWKGEAGGQGSWWCWRWGAQGG